VRNPAVGAIDNRPYLLYSTGIAALETSMSPFRRTRHPTLLMPVGTRVKSHYRARWTGVVVEVVERNEREPYRYRHFLLRVKVTHDRRGRPMRKPIYHWLDSAWLTPVE